MDAPQKGDCAFAVVFVVLIGIIVFCVTYTIVNNFNRVGVLENRVRELEARTSKE